MRKLLLFFAMLCVSIGAWAGVTAKLLANSQNNASNGKGFTFTHTAYQVNVEHGGDLASANVASIADSENENNKINLNTATYLVFTGKLNADDLAAINANVGNSSNDVYLDFSGATFVDGATIADLSKQSIAKYIILPDGTSEINTDLPSSVKEVLAYNGNELLGHSVSGGALEHVLWFDRRFAESGNTITDYTLSGTYTYIQDTNVTRGTYSTSGKRNSVFGVMQLMEQTEYQGNANIVNLDLRNAVFPNYTDEDKEYTATEGASTTWTGPTNGMELINIYSSSLESVILPETDETTLIPYQAFYNCSKISSLEIPGNIKTLGMEAFYSLTGAETITFNVGLETMAPDVFLNCTSVTSISLPVGLRNIGKYAFIKCTSLKELVIPEGVEVIEAGAFEQTDIKTVRLPNSLKRIEMNAFRQCQKLETMTFPENLEYIGEDAFRLCYGLTDVYFLGTTTIPEVHANAFDGASYANSGGLASGGETATSESWTYGNYPNALIDANQGTRKKVDMTSWVTYDNGVKTSGATVLHYPLVSTEATYAASSINVDDYNTAQAAAPVVLYYKDSSDNYVQLSGAPKAGVQYYEATQAATTTETTSPVSGVTQYYSDAEGTTSTTPTLNQNYYYACGESTDYQKVDLNKSWDYYSKYYVLDNGNYVESPLYFNNTYYYYSEEEVTASRYLDVSWAWYNNIKSKTSGPFYTKNGTSYEEVLPSFNNTTLYYYDAQNELKPTTGMVKVNDVLVTTYYNESGVSQDFQLDNNGGNGYYYYESYDTHYVPSNTYITGKTWSSDAAGTTSIQSFNWYNHIDNNQKYYYDNGKKIDYCSTNEYDSSKTYYTDNTGNTEVTSFTFSPAVYYFANDSYAEAPAADVATASLQNTTLYSDDQGTVATAPLSAGTYYEQTSAASSDLYGEYYTDTQRNANYGGIYRGDEGDGFDKTHGLTTWPTYWDFGIWTNNGNQFPRTGLSTPDGVNRDGLKNFILVSGFPVDPSVPDNPVKTIEHIKKDVWYTMCFPFDLTDTQLQSCFGAGYEVAQFASVVENDSKTGYVLNFTTSVNPDANGVVTHKHVPYMIHPNSMAVNEDGTPKETVFTLTGITETQEDHDADQAMMMENSVAVSGYGGTFTFVGYGHNYQPSSVMIPRYSFFLGTKKGETYPKYWRQTGEDTRASGGYWNKNIAIVLPPSFKWSEVDDRTIYSDTKDGDSYVLLSTVRGETSDKYKNYICEEYMYTPSSSAGAKALTNFEIMFTDDPIEDKESMGGTTAIKDVEEVVKSTVANGKVFSINGQYMGNSLENLPKGIYILNGKKYVIK